LYNNETWIKNVQEAVATVPRNGSTVALIGHSKDSSSFYLKLFPQWESIEVESYGTLNATEVRERLFDPFMLGKSMDWFKDKLSPPIVDYISTWVKQQAYHDMVAEYEFVRDYKDNVAVIDTSNVPAIFKDELETLLPYLKAKPKWPPKYVTVDAVVVQSGHVLLIQRGGFPGKGLWALPGGFLNDEEKILDGVIRELKEETRIKVPAAVLRGSIVAQKVFDDPHRSSRGRTIDHAFLFHLHEDGLPKIKGSDDAVFAKWVPLSEVKREMMFEDHFDIIENLTGLL
jgi:bifunctional NMN adenylyltransferase/nudix hydrolase